MPNAQISIVIRTSDALDKIEEDVCEVAAAWYEQRSGDMQREMNRRGFKERIKTEYRALLLKLVEELH